MASLTPGTIAAQTITVCHGKPVFNKASKSGAFQESVICVLSARLPLCYCALDSQHRLYWQRIGWIDLLQPRVVYERLRRADGHFVMVSEPCERVRGKAGNPGQCHARPQQDLLARVPLSVCAQWSDRTTPEPEETTSVLSGNLNKMYQGCAHQTGDAKEGVEHIHHVVRTVRDAALMLVLQERHTV